MAQENSIGKIVTFYSFKGGVGRTMAVANLAFLAALNGKRVLVMDWDLEAPGLAYYFRGLLSSAETRALGDAPGVLDILSEWSATIEKAESDEEVSALQQRFEEGSVFKDCVRTLIEAEMSADLLPATAALDIISAGSNKVKAITTAGDLPYEEALAQFSWADFFDKYAGGFALEQLRLWAKKNYDFVLIDSRTGLSDIAGVCTMQLPDSVALCFALNQQNIDGIAKVSAAIRSKRQDAVIQRAIPMRVGNIDAADGSDAQARALSALSHIGGGISADIKADMAMLSIKLVDDLPFYETLAPFVAKDPELDKLTLNYLRLGKHLLDVSLSIPVFNSEVLKKIQQRLQPRNATIEYINSLQSAEPVRAIDELSQLIDAAYDTAVNGGVLDEIYLHALLEVGIDISEQYSIEDDFYIKLEKTLDTICVLYKKEPVKWKEFLVSEIQLVIEYSMMHLPANNVRKWFCELDNILVNEVSTASRLKRMNYLRSSAQISLDNNDGDALNDSVSRINNIYQSIISEKVVLDPVEKKSMQASIVDVQLLLGNIALKNNDIAEARECYENGLSLFPSLDLIETDTDLGILCFRLHYQLTKLPILTKLEAAQHASKAVRFSGRLFRFKFFELAKFVLQASDYPEVILDFCESFVNVAESNNQLILSQYLLGGASGNGVNLIDFISDFSKILIVHNTERANSVLRSLLQLLSFSFDSLIRRKIIHGDAIELRDKLSFQLNELSIILAGAGISMEDFSGLAKAQNAYSGAFSSDDSSMNAE
ncbi:AAA family ATPase [Iodobacter sp. CM08]|uniref:KGGVGR-motif variant AAA ATPase n=1 Tax=Iodobacter sp. CM08 TaxID=3085902 RepID=UPI0029811878|nr:AAA family ATPase [Iodobacter sp. CM08]MDW5416843.1 AAA family ATPase [Iodobacter sp. CM08]